MNREAAEAPTITEFVFQKLDSFSSDEVAIIQQDSQQTLTYGQLKRQSISIASALLKRGFGCDQFLSLFTLNCIENAPISYGTMATGGTLDLIKPSISVDELIYHLGRVQPRFVVTSAERASTLLASLEKGNIKVDDVFVIGMPRSSFKNIKDLFDDPGDLNPFGRILIKEDDCVAAMLHTGGTTGVSKSVMNTHKALKVTFARASLPIGKGDIVASFTPFSYASAFNAPYGAFMYRGVQVVDLPGFKPKNVISAISEYNATILVASPATLHAIASSPEIMKHDLSSLRYIAYAGAPMPKETEKFVTLKIQERCPSVQFYQAYAMTETCGISTMASPEDRMNPKKEGTCGTALPQVEIKVVNPLNEDKICKQGEAGHILLKSPSLMKGYFKNEKKTKDVLKDGWYHTCDYGWLDEDGHLYVVDRIDELIIKEEGVISPSKLEDIIRSNANVEECVVLEKNINNEKWPIAFVVANGEIASEEIQQYVAERVEPYSQLKGGVKFVKEVPTSLAGKLLRKAFIEKLDS